MTTTIRIVAALAAIFSAATCHAQNAPAGGPAYPTRQVRVIVPYPPGGPTDVIARLISQKLTDALGQTYFVENLPGASGAIGAGTAANSPGVKKMPEPSMSPATTAPTAAKPSSRRNPTSERFSGIPATIVAG